jgi:uncharacterized protein
MSRLQGEYSIRYAGLPEGSHSFDYVVNGKFFTSYFPETEIHDASVQIHIDAERHASFLELIIHISGSVRVECDRCLDPCDVQLSDSQVLIFSSAGQQHHSEDDDVVVEVGEEVDHVVLDSYLYDFILLAIPFRRVHDELDGNDSSCNQEMLDRIKNLEIKTSNEPIWDELNKIKFDN